MGERDESNLWMRLGDVYGHCDVRVHTLWLAEGVRGWMATMIPRSGVSEAISVTGETLREVLVKAVSAVKAARLTGPQHADESAGRPDS